MQFYDLVYLMRAELDLGVKGWSNVRFVTQNRGQNRSIGGGVGKFVKLLLGNVWTFPYMIGFKNPSLENNTRKDSGS